MAAPSRDFRDIVVSRRDACVKFTSKTPSRDRQKALQFYRGDDLSDYGDREDGQSAVVSRDLMEAVEGVLPSLIRPFVAGDQIVSYEPKGPEDEEGAKQAADYDNFVFTTHNNAFRVIYDSMKDGLMFRLGIAKTVMEEEQDGGPTRYEGLDQTQLGALLAEAPEIVGEIAQDEATGLYSVTTGPKTVKRYRVHVVAPDEFLYEERLASLDQATFLGHTKQVTLADLIDMGVDEKVAKGLGSGRPDSEERDERFKDEDETEFADDDLARPIWVDECYIKCDPDKTGVLEWRKVLLGGSQSKILSDEPADGHPYSVWTPIPITHKLEGMSYFDITRDIQTNKTAIQRETNNAMYLANRPQRAVLDGAVNMDDLLNPKLDGIVRVKQLGAIENLASGGERVFGHSLEMIEYMDSLREARTGVTRYNQGMDAQSLNKTATGMNIIASASQQRQELIARQFAEFLIDIFKKLRALVSQHADKSEFIRLRGKWVEVDPSDWKTNYDMTVSVGLGSNNKDQLVGQLQGLLGIQQQIIELQGGVNGPLVTLDNAYETLKRLQEAMGLKGEKYFTDPGEVQQQPEEDAEPSEAEVELQKEQIRQEGAANVAQIRGQFDLAKSQPQVVPFPVDPSMGAAM